MGRKYECSCLLVPPLTLPVSHGLSNSNGIEIYIYYDSAKIQYSNISQLQFRNKNTMVFLTSPFDHVIIEWTECEIGLFSSNIRLSLLRRILRIMIFIFVIIWIGIKLDECILNKLDQIGNLFELHAVYGCVVQQTNLRKEKMTSRDRFWEQLFHIHLLDWSVYSSTL